MFDCIIVGAGPAGTTTGYHLAKKGHSVLIIEKASLPRYKPCGGGVSPAIATWLDLDFSPVIENTITKVQYSWKMGEQVEVELKDIEPIWMVKRDTFDHFLAQQAQQQGAKLEDKTEVTAIAFENNNWNVTTNQGNFTAPYVIAADGVKGVMAKWLGFKERKQFLGATLEIETNMTPEKQNIVQFDFGSLKNGYIWNFPKANGNTISGGIFRAKGKGNELKKQMTNYANNLGLDLNKSQYFEYALGLWTENQPLHTQNALLVGEAAGITDPLTGEGIRPSVLTGYRAAEAIHQALGGDQEALSQYTQIIQQEWGNNMLLAQRLAGLFFQFPKIAYKVGVKNPTAGQLMAKILCGELRYSDVTEKAMQKLKKSLIPGMGK